MRLIGRMGIAAAVLAAMATLAAPAMACSLTPPQAKMPPLPVPGATQADGAALMTAWNIVQRSHREVAERDNLIWRQRQMFDGADSVVLARVETAGRSESDDGRQKGLAYVTLAPLRWVKGRGDTGAFQLGVTGLTSCGPIPDYDAIQGDPGDVFLVYLEGNILDQASVTGTLAVDRLVEASTLAALDVALN